MTAEVIALPRPVPHDDTAEAHLLGLFLWWSSDPDVIAGNLARAELDALDPANFHAPKHMDIARAMVRLRDRGDAVDVTTVWNELGVMRRANTVTLAYLGEISARAQSATAAPALGRRVREIAEHRTLIGAYRAALAALERADGSVAQASDAAMATVLAARSSGPRKGPRHIGALLDELDDEMMRRARGEVVRAYKTGIPALDGVLDPFEAGELIVVGARPSTGKTSLAMAVALSIAMEVVRLTRRTGEHGSVLFFSLETTDTKLVRRALASASGVGLSIVSGRAPCGPEAVQRLRESSNWLYKLPFWIDDRFGLPVSEMRATCRAHARDHGLSLIVVDYLQLLRGAARKDGRRVDEVAEVSRELKAIAKEFGVPVLALAQLNRGVETRSDKRPTLADLRESGQIEQDADKVVLLHRENKQSRELIAIIAKQRDGAADTEAVLEFDGPTTGFSIDHDDALDEPAPPGTQEWGGTRTEEHDDAPF